MSDHEFGIPSYDEVGRYVEAIARFGAGPRIARADGELRVGA